MNSCSPYHSISDGLLFWPEKNYSRDCLQFSKILFTWFNLKIKKKKVKVPLGAKRCCRLYLYSNSSHLQDFCLSNIGAWCSVLHKAGSVSVVSNLHEIPFFLVTWNYFCAALTLKQKTTVVVFFPIFFLILEGISSVAPETLSEIICFEQAFFLFGRGGNRHTDIYPFNFKHTMVPKFIWRYWYWNC